MRRPEYGKWSIMSQYYDENYDYERHLTPVDGSPTS
jgi:hypothetical protein